MNWLKKLPWVVVGILVILIGLEVGVFRQRWFWAAVPRSNAGIFYFVENQIRTSPVAPKIIFMGDSRLRDAVHPYNLEQLLGLKRGEIVNLALTSGDIWDAKLFLSRTPSLLDSVQVVIYQIPDWRYDEGYLPTNRFRHFATLRERLHYHDKSSRVELVIGYFLHMVAGRNVLQGNIERLGKNVVGPLMGKDMNEPPIVDSMTGRVHWRLVEKELGPDSIDVTKYIQDSDHDYGYSPWFVEQMDELVTKFREAGAQVVFLEPTMRDSYVSVACNDSIDGYGIWKEAVRMLAERFAVPIWSNEKIKMEAGIVENEFYDYGHLTLEGMRRYTIWLSERILEDFIPL